MRAIAFALPALMTFGASAPATAGGCNDEIVANIAIAPGRVCWVYRGPATVFTGEFAGGQRLTVQMGGGRMPSASGPGGFNTEASGSSLAFFAPRGGIYRFSFYPCALWGSSAAVQICAR